jgi:aryl-alcohol dehydrogenase-like predicted oxidoreductase
LAASPSVLIFFVDRSESLIGAVSESLGARRDKMIIASKFARVLGGAAPGGDGSIYFPAPAFPLKVEAFNT